MRTTSKIGSFAVLAAAAGLAVSASGCVIQTSSSPGCIPDLSIPWDIVRQSNPSTLLTCAQAGASWVQANVNGRILNQPCPANATSGTLVDTYESQAGYYDVTVGLYSDLSSPPIFQTSTLTQPIDCTGTSTTPIADLSVNL